jgi:serine/threonine protein kinase
LPGVLRRGTRLGKYRLERSIGKGAFSEVFAARDTVEGRRVALKIAFDWVVREFGREAMELEARIACSLSHPNIVATRNADWIDGRFVMASELARTHVYDYPRAWRSGETALSIVRDVAAGLAHAHERRLMHRDLKPENVLVFADGHAAITDFGVSRFVRQESRSYTEAGTMGYMAPEQAYGKPTLASDVFSLGLIAYELLTGKLLKWPFSWPPERFDRFRAKVPEPLRAVLQKACAFDPSDRYPSGVELHAALEAAFRRLEPAPRVRRRRRRRAGPEPTPFAVGMELFRKRHGRALGLRHRCHRCNGPIAEPMSVCPWCGSRSNSFAETTSAPLVCRHCERGVLP